jgi:hypothetical protein
MPSLDQLSQIATIATGIAAVAALIMVVWQVRWSRQLQERATGYEIYTQFLSVTLNQPEVSTIELSDADTQNLTVNGDPNKFVRYEVYVDLMIVAFEQLLKLTHNDERTREYLRSYLEQHKAYLCSSRFNEFKGQLDDELLAFVDELCLEWNRGRAQSGRVAA